MRDWVASGNTWPVLGHHSTFLNDYHHGTVMMVRRDWNCHLRTLIRGIVRCLYCVGRRWEFGIVICAGDEGVIFFKGTGTGERGSYPRQAWDHAILMPIVKIPIATAPSAAKRGKQNTYGIADDEILQVYPSHDALLKHPNCVSIRSIWRSILQATLHGAKSHKTKSEFGIPSSQLPIPN